MGVSVQDIIKKSFLKNFMEAISLETLIVSSVVSLIFAIGVYIVYLLTCDKTIYSKKFNIAMSLMTVITSSLVLAMQSNIVISLGMVGALSIVRFRTAIKEPKDLLFLFWAISNGIIIGAGLYSVAVVLAIALLIFELIPEKGKSMLLVINFKDLDKEAKIEEVLKNQKVKFTVKSKNVFKDKVDIKNIKEYVISKKISQFIDEQSEQVITDWDLATHKDLDSVLERFVLNQNCHSL